MVDGSVNKIISIIYHFTIFNFSAVTKMSPRPSLVPDTVETTTITSNESLTPSSQQQQSNQNSGQKVDPAKPPR